MVSRKKENKFRSPFLGNETGNPILDREIRNTKMYREIGPSILRNESGGSKLSHESGGALLRHETTIPNVAMVALVGIRPANVASLVEWFNYYQYDNGCRDQPDKSHGAKMRHENEDQHDLPPVWMH